MSGSESYSWLDQILHKIAFKGIWVQRELAAIEDRIFADQFGNIPIEQPVFITSLPRAGTTLLLEILSSLSTFACHTYRDMPFVLCPIFWDKMTRAFRKEVTLRARAHGDGIAIGYDSPEAFEEIIWMTFWREKYSSDRIKYWSTTDRKENFEHFLRNHLRKIVGLRSISNGDGLYPRYISKNNANIARLELLTVLFPDCRIIIPVRNPWDHVRSLRKQHERFTALHAKDRFSQLYMEWLGHFEFGAGLRPIDFGGWMDNGALLDPLTDTFWVTYWVKTYEAILTAVGSNIYFFNYDRACAEPAPSLEALALALGFEDLTELLAQVSRFRKPTEHARASEEIDTSLRAQVCQVYKAIEAQSSL